MFLIFLILSTFSTHLSPTGHDISSYYTFTPDSYSNIYYLDFSLTTGLNDGSSPANAFQNWDSLIFTGPGLNSDSAYLFKKGVSFEILHNFGFVDKHDVLLASYGDEGESKPVINSIHALGVQNCRDVIIADLEWFYQGSTGWHGGDTAWHSENGWYDKQAFVISKFHQARADGLPENIWIIGNDIHHYSGAFVFDNSGHSTCYECHIFGMKIIGNHIYDLWEDGVFGSGYYGLEIAYNKIERCSAEWHEWNRVLHENDNSYYKNLTLVEQNGVMTMYCPYGNVYQDHCPDGELDDRCYEQLYVPPGCGGDNIQITGINMWIHHNILDRSDTGNKFNVLLSTVGVSGCEGEDGCIVEHNIWYGPLWNGSGGTNLGVYSQLDYGDNAGMHVRYNEFHQEQNNGFYASGQYIDIYFYGNILYGAKIHTVEASFRSESDSYLFFKQNTIINHEESSPLLGNLFILNCDVGYIGNNIISLNNDIVWWNTCFDQTQENNIYYDHGGDLWWHSGSHTDYVPTDSEIILNEPIQVASYEKGYLIFNGNSLPVQY